MCWSLLLTARVVLLRDRDHRHGRYSEVSLLPLAPILTLRIAMSPKSRSIDRRRAVNEAIVFSLI